MSNDAIECRIHSWIALDRWRVTIGDTTYEFPEGTTRAQAEAVLSEAKARYLRSLMRLVPE